MRKAKSFKQVLESTYLFEQLSAEEEKGIVEKPLNYQIKTTETEKGIYFERIIKT